MRRDPHVVRAEAAIESQPALVANDLARAIHHALVRQLASLRVALLLLQTRLDEVERQREETGEEAGDAGGREDLAAGGQVGVLLELGFGFREERKLADVERHGANDGGERASPQGGDSLVPGDAD